MSAEQAHLVPADEAAARLHRHPITLRRDLRAGTLPGRKVGGRWFMSSTDLDRITGPSSPDPSPDPNPWKAPE